MPNGRVVSLSSGRSLFLAESGAGIPLVLIHGSLATHRDWVSGSFEDLAQLGRAVAVDRPGHGKSRRVRFDASPRDQARQIAEGLEMAGIAPAILVAHSMGAMAALALTELFPKRVRGLLLLAPFAFPEPRPMEHWLLSPRAAPLMGPWLSEAASRSIDPLMLAQLQRLMFDPQPIPPEWKATFPYDEVLDSDNLVAEGEDFAALVPGSAEGLFDYGQMRVPVQIGFGTADRIIAPDRHALPLSKLLPHAAVTSFRGGGHMIHHSHRGEIVDLARALTNQVQLQSDRR